jgi:Flp pilus assembly protein TadG
LSDQRRERGAAAVEFALILPVLLILVLGIVEYGRAYNTQTIVSGAAREGVRVMALQNSQSAARSATKTAASPTLALTDTQITISPATGACTTGTFNATVKVVYDMPFITNFFGTTVKLTGTGVMRCNG